MEKCCSKFSCALFVLSMLSIVASIAIWYLTKGDTAETSAHAERFGIFVGLWAPTFMGLANYFKPTVVAKSETGCCSK